MLSNEDVEKLLTMENCMEALEYAYGELGRVGGDTALVAGYVTG